MLRSRAWRPANDLRNFSRSCLRHNVVSTSSLSPQNERSDARVNVAQGSQAKPLQEIHANVPEGVREPLDAASVGDPKVQSSDFPRRVDSKTSAYDLDIIKERVRDWMTLATAAFKQQSDELRQRTDYLTQTTSTKFFQLGSQLNRVTGYEQIEALKQRVVEQGVLHSLPISRILRVVLPKRLESRLLEKQLEKLRQRMTTLSCNVPSPSDK
jgi:sensitive to high expression protein 9